LVVNKPSGPSSHDIVAQARRLFKTRTIGHAGTLDPMASGVLLLLVEEATKLSSALTLERKSYRAIVRFGFGTDTDDALGAPTEYGNWFSGWLQPSQLERALEQERCRTAQLPPRVSAIKQGGVTAYRRHRRGEVVELLPRTVKVHELSVVSVNDDRVELMLSVSKGYYVRSLARDLGLALSMPAHLSSLCRTSSGCFGLDEATDWPCVSAPSLMPLTRVVERAMPTRVLTEDGARRAKLGQRLSAADFAPSCLAVTTQDASLAQPLADALTAWLDPSGRLVALGRTEADGTPRVARGFREGA
jgi:tRNA pseudouridine55 synthase